MTFILGIFNDLYQMGYTVTMPVFFALLGLILGLGLNRSLRSGLAITASIFGINLIVNRLGSELLTVSQLIADRFGLAGEVTSVSYQTSSAIAFGSSISLYIIPICLIVNMIMIAVGCCRTFNADIWNLWHMAFTGALVQSLTGSFAYGLMAAVLNIVFILVLADMSSQRVTKVTGIKGVAVTNGYALAFFPICWAVNSVADLIPSQKGKRKTFEDTVAGWGVFGEPALWAVALGIVLGVLGGKDVFGVLQLGAVAGISALLIPLAAGMLRGGFTPIAEALEDRINGRFKTKGRFSIGFATALGMVDPTVVVITLAVVPLTIIFGLAVPGVRMLPTGDASMLLYISMAAVMLSGGGLVRSLISAAISSAAALWCASGLAELFTQAARALNYELYGSLGIINSMADGSSPIALGEVWCASYAVAGMGLLVLIALALLIVNRNRIAGEHKLALVKAGQQVEPVAGDIRHWTNYLKTSMKDAEERRRARKQPEDPKSAVDTEEDKDAGK